MRRGRGRARAAGRVAAGWARSAGALPYRPERRSAAEWTAAYRAGALGYYGQLDEMGRYSILAGYVGWAAGRPGRGPQRVLDVGCGTGLLRARLPDAAVAEYVGVDLSEAAVQEAEGAGYARSRFLVADAGQLDLGPFDVVVLNEVLYYAADPSAFLATLGRSLRPDGLVLISMWRHPGDRALWRVADAAFPIVDRVDVRNPGNPVNSRGWRVALCGNPVGGPAAPSEAVTAAAT